MPELVLPDPRYQASCLAAMVEDPAVFAGWGTSPPDQLASATAFTGYVEELRAEAEDRGPGPEIVPQTVLWWVEGDELLARVGIRHRLNHRLRTYGGHVGYWVRPSARRRGHATAAFRAALGIAHGLGVDPALLTCDQDNVASRRVIEGAGGVLEQRLDQTRLYWVPTRPGGPTTTGSTVAPV